MAGLKSFSYVNRTLLIYYNIDQLRRNEDRDRRRLHKAPSQIFGHDSKSIIKWKVHVCLNNRMLYIEPVDANVNQIFQYNLSVKMNGQPRNYGSATYNGMKFECRFPNFDVRWIEIKIVYPLEAINQIVPASVKRSKTNTSLPKMLTNTRSRDKFADVQFIVEGKVIVAHKVILADRSEVFYKMFIWNADNATNNNTQPIQISDVSYDGFNQFMDTIYYGTTPVGTAISLEVLNLCEKYDVQDIKIAVEETLIASLNMENAITLLISAYLNNADRMKKAVLKYCAKNPIHEMIGSKELGRYPDLLNEVFKEISLTKNL